MKSKQCLGRENAGERGVLSTLSTRALWTSGPLPGNILDARRARSI